MSSSPCEDEDDEVEEEEEAEEEEPDRCMVEERSKDPAEHTHEEQRLNEMASVQCESWN